MSFISVTFLFLALATLVKSPAATIIHGLFVHLVNPNEASLLVLCGFVASFATLHYLLTCTRKKVYLVDFACYKPDPSCICSKEMFMDRSTRIGHFSEDSLLFQRRILDTFGVGDKTYLPESLLKIPPDFGIDEKRKETETVIIGAIDELLLKTKVKAEDIGILVINSTIFTPIPSLCAMVVNHYKLRHNILSYNLSGMGCSAGLISIDLAKQLLQVHPNCYALVVSTENMNSGWYLGNNRSMLITNCVFRMGGAAILLSNNSSDYSRSKYQLTHTVRTHEGSKDDSYNSIMQMEDETQKRTGLAISMKLLTPAGGEALRDNISALGKYVLPLTEQLKFLANLVARKLFKMKNVKPYTPNFKLAFEHFCFHTGAKKAQDELQKVLGLGDWHMEPSRMTLYRFGNTSSSSVWYGLAYSEAKGRVRKGDRIFQVAFGSGVKCNSAVWCALKTIDPTKDGNPWSDEIHEFPVDVTN